MVDFKAQKQVLNELEAVRVLMTSVTDAIRLMKVDHTATQKPCATVDTEKASRERTGAEMPESWLKMVRDSVLEGVDQRVTQAVQSAVSEATKDLLLECQRLRECKPDHSETGKPCAMADTEQVSMVGRSAEMQESWLKMVQDVVCEGVTQAVQGAMSEATKDLLLECWRLRECQQVESPLPNVSKKVQQHTTATLPTSSGTGRLAKKESELSRQKTGGKPAAPIHIPPLDFSALSKSQKEHKSRKLLSDSVPGRTGENAPWPTRPSAIRESIPRAKSSPPQPSYHQGRALSAVESKLNHPKEPLPGHEAVLWSHSSIHSDAASLSTEVVQTQALDGTKLDASEVI